MDLISAVNDFRDQFEYEFQEVWMENEEVEELNGEAIEGLITKNLYDKYKPYFEEYNCKVDFVIFAPKR